MCKPPEIIARDIKEGGNDRSVVVVKVRGIYALACIENNMLRDAHITIALALTPRSLDTSITLQVADDGRTQYCASTTGVYVLVR